MQMIRKIKYRKDKKIGRVLFVVEGAKDEIKILEKVFTEIFDYQYESKNRLDKYRPKNLKENPASSVFVINSHGTNIESINDANGYLDAMFLKLINEYDFPVDKATIFYVFDRDVKSNTKIDVIKDLISKLSNSRDNELYDKAGLLLLSYPAIESFVVSNFEENSFQLEFELGKEAKKYLHEKQCSIQRIDENTFRLAFREMLNAFSVLGVEDYDLDSFRECNELILDWQENHYSINKKYRMLSLLCMAFIDLGLIEIEE